GTRRAVRGPVQPGHPGLPGGAQARSRQRGRHDAHGADRRHRLAGQRARPRDGGSRARAVRPRAGEGSELRPGAALPRAGALRGEEGRARGDQVVGEVPGAHAGRRGPRARAEDDRRGPRWRAEALAGRRQGRPDLRRTASGTATTASPLTTTSGTVHTTSTFTMRSVLTMRTSFSASGTPASLAAVITLAFSSREGIVSTPSLETISCTALLTATYENAASIPE